MTAILLASVVEGQSLSIGYLLAGGVGEGHQPLFLFLSSFCKGGLRRIYKKERVGFREAEEKGN